MAATTAIERIGTTIAQRYELRRLIGEGGFSTVFEAVHNVTGRPVAIKLLHAHLTQTDQIAERFLMEARAMARINHEGIVQVIDAGTDVEGSVYIALELLDGESLEAMLLREKTLPWPTAVSICIDVLGALAEAHKHSIIHRDIKPGNIFIAAKPGGGTRARLLDFGIASVTREKGKLTAAGMILGTPEYMSPEQGRTSNVGPPSDLWAVGIVMWECLTGRTPFLGETATDTLIKIATTDAPPIRTEVPELPLGVAAVIDKSLSRDLAHRFRTADEMRESLLRATRRGNESAPRTPTRPPAVVHPGDERWAPAPTDVVSPDALASVGSTEVTPGRPVAPVVSGDAGARVARPATLPPANKVLSPPPRPSSPALAAARAAPTLAETVASPVESAERPVVQRASPPPPEPPDATRSVRPSPSPEAPSPRPPRAAQISERVSRNGDDPLPRTSRERPTTGTQRPTFQPLPLPTEPPPNRRRVQLAAAVVALASAVAMGTLLEIRAARRARMQTEPTALDPASQPAPTATPHTVRVTFAPVEDAHAPVGLPTADDAAVFARNAAASAHAGGTQRVVASCVGSRVYAQSMSSGPLRASAPETAACHGHDLGVVPDVNGDGSDDLVFVGPYGQLIVVDSATLASQRTLELTDARAIATGAQVRLRGEPAVITLSEPQGPDGPIDLAAVGAASTHVLWRVSESAFRSGEGVSLAVGGDANGDGVGDVVADLVPAAAGPAQHCVQVFSGADGRPAWSTPRCTPGASSARPVALGPDVNGDGRGDVLLARAGSGGGSVVLLSGVDGAELRVIDTRAGVPITGLALAGDLDGDHTPDVAVAQGGSVTVYEASSGRSLATFTPAGAQPDALTVFAVPPLVDTAPWSLAVATPGAGIHLYARRESDEPRTP